MKRPVAIALAAAAFGPLSVVAAAGPGAAASAGEAGRVSEAGRARLCFPAAIWDAPDHERPCYRIRGPYEDGSGRLVIQADTIRSRCTIPNVHEEPPEFALACTPRGG